jgi:hypothetical protein
MLCYDPVTIHWQLIFDLFVWAFGRTHDTTSRLYVPYTHYRPIDQASGKGVIFSALHPLIARTSRIDAATLMTRCGRVCDKQQIDSSPGVHSW